MKLKNLKGNKKTLMNKKNNTLKKMINKKWKKNIKMKNGLLLLL